MFHMRINFLPSPFNEAAVLAIDGVGEWATTTIDCPVNTEIIKTANLSTLTQLIIQHLLPTVVLSKFGGI